MLLLQQQPDRPDWLPDEELSTGTTLVAMEFDGGVVLGADTRTSMGTYVANRAADKLTPVSERIMACRSGSSADTQAVTDIVKYKMDVVKNETGRPVEVYKAAFMFKSICYDYRDQLTAGIIVAGYDDKLGGQVYAIPLGGMMVRQKAAIAGSGSTFLYGFVDSQYRENMAKEECTDLVLKCVTLAIKRDGSSGGCCRLAIITKEEVERRNVLYDELPQL